MKRFLDTNVLIYAIDTRDEIKRAEAEANDSALAKRARRYEHNLAKRQRIKVGI